MPTSTTTEAKTKTKKKRASVSELRRRERELVSKYAKIRELKEQLKVLEKPAKKEADELYKDYGISAVTGPEGIVAISEVAGSKRLDPKKVRELLNEDEVESCTVTGSPTIRAVFTPKHAG